MQRARRNISYVLLTLFLLMKTVGLHSFEHIDEDFEKYCETCEYVISSNTIPLLSESSPQIVVPNIYLFNNKTTKPYYFFIELKNNINSKLLSRPPPII